MAAMQRVALVLLLGTTRASEHPHHARHHAKHNAPHQDESKHSLRMHAHGHHREEIRRQSPDYQVHRSSEDQSAPAMDREHSKIQHHYKKGTVKTMHGRTVHMPSRDEAVHQTRTASVVSRSPSIPQSQAQGQVRHAIEVENAEVLHADQRSHAEHQKALRGRTSAKQISCGVLTEQPDAKPANYKDARKTKYDKKTKKMVKVTFSASDSITFKCKRGFTIDGTKGGDTEFEVECTEAGYYKPAKTCIEVSKCEDPPTFAHAHVSKLEGGQLEYSCDDGYSLDGEKVVVGGSGKNSIFGITCQEEAGIWTKWEGECKPYGFMPTSKVIGIYNNVFGALFHHSCKNTIINEFGKLHGPNPGLDKVCAKLPKKEGDCSPLVDKIKSDFEKMEKKRKKYEKDQGKDWYDKDPNAPGISDEADKFCDKLWGLISFGDLIDEK